MYLCLLGLAFVFQSCESDSSEGSNHQTVITGYTVTRDSQFTNVSGGLSTSKSITTFLMNNNRLLSGSMEVFIDGVSTGVSTIIDYTYQDSLLTSVDEPQNGGRREFYYDANSKLIGVKMTFYQQDRFYRLVYLTNNVVYLERISAPYNDMAAQILRRNIVVFDNDDNIVQAGVDMDLDGVVENVNTYTYSDNNLVNANLNGNLHTFQYSTMINNKGYIKDATFGKRNLRLINAELYSYGIIQSPEFDYLNSQNLLSSEINNGTDEVRSDNFVKKHISTELFPEGATVTTTEYFFR